MKRLIAVLACSSLLLAACGQTKNERTRPKNQATNQPAGAAENPIAEEDPSTNPIKPLEDEDGFDIPANEEPEPVKETPAPVATTPTPPATTAPAPSPVPTTPIVLGPVGKALEAALKGVGANQKLDVYGYKWKISKATIAKEGNTIKIEGLIIHSVWWDFDEKIFYEFTYEDGKLVTSDIFIDNKPSPFMIVGPILSAVGLAYGVPIPPTAINGIVVEIEKMAAGSWNEAAQKLAFRIGMEAFRQNSK